MRTATILSLIFASAVLAAPVPTSEAVADVPEPGALLKRTSADVADVPEPGALLKRSAATIADVTEAGNFI
jgi:hypothetical protein